MHVDPQWVIVALTIFTTLLVPTLWFMVRGAIKWTKVEDKLGTLIDQMKIMVMDKEKTHREMLETMRLDREATDRRLRYIEEFWMSQGRISWQGRREDYEFHGTGSRGAVQPGPPSAE